MSNKKGKSMFEMAMVLFSSGVLMFIAYEFNSLFTKREWGENTKSIF